MLRIKFEICVRGIDKSPLTQMQSSTIENSVGGRWYGPEKTCDEYLKSMHRRNFLSFLPPVPPVTEEEVRLFGRDYPVFLAVLAKWDGYARGSYSQFSTEGKPLHQLYLMDLDLHTLPPLPPDLVRVSFTRMPNLLKIPRKVIEGLDLLEIKACPLLEDIGDIPEKRWHHIDIPGFRSSYVPASTIAVINEASHRFKRKVWCLENKENIMAELNKPSRILWRLKEYGWEYFDPPLKN